MVRVNLINPKLLTDEHLRAEYVELQCGVDWRFLDQEKAHALKKAHFENMRLAWDGSYKLLPNIKKALNYLIYAGYNKKEIQIFMLTNGKIRYEECKKN